MSRFSLGISGSRGVESSVHLREIAELDRDAEFAEIAGAKTELSPPNPVSLAVSCRNERVKPAPNGPDKLQIVDAGDQIDPNLVRVHQLNGTSQTSRYRGMVGLLSVTLCLGTAQSGAQNLEACLLGVQLADKRFASYWVQREGASLRIQRVPGPMRLKVGGSLVSVTFLRRETPRGLTEDVAFDPAPASYSPIPDGGTRTIWYLGEEIWTYEDVIRDRTPLLRTERLRGTGPGVVEIEISPAAQTSLMDAARTARESMSIADRDLIAEKYDPRHWGIRRGEGQWQVVGRLMPISDAFRAKVVDFLMPDPLPIRFGSRNPTFRTVRSRLSETRDVVNSPSGAMSVVLLESEIRVYSLKDGRLDRQAGFAGTDAPRVVATQWLTGAEVESFRGLLFP